MSDDNSDQSYEIRILGATRSSAGLAQKILYPEGRCHSFFVLTKDGDPQAELQFTPKDDTGQLIPISKSPLNIADAFFNVGGLEKPFKKLIAHSPLSGRLVHLKGVMTRPRHDLTDPNLIEFGSVRGAPGHILSTWNRACEIAVRINQADIVFTTGLRGGPGPANCHAGTKTVLKGLGDEFSSASRAIESRAGRDLTREIDNLKWPKVEAVSLESLLYAQQKLKLALYQTSRKVFAPISEQASFTSRQFEQAL